MNKFIHCLLLALFGLATTLNAQVYNYEDGEGPVPPDSVKGLYFGLNLGVYFANNNTASIYGGYGYQRDGVIISQFSQSWLNQAIQGSFFAEDRTSAAMNAAPNEWIFAESDMPGLMQYSGSFLYGLHLRYMFNSDFGLIAEVNGTNPVTVGEFTIQRIAPSPDPLQNNRLERFQIRGEEQRLMINLGLHRVMGRKAAESKGKEPSILPYFDLGGCVTFVRFEENVINLGSEGVVDITQFFTQQGIPLDQANLLTGIGFGGYGGLGGQLTLGRKFTINLGYVANLQQIKLGELNEIGFQHQIVLRAIYM